MTATRFGLGKPAAKARGAQVKPHPLTYRTTRVYAPTQTNQQTHDRALPGSSSKRGPVVPMPQVFAREGVRCGRRLPGIVSDGARKLKQQVRRFVLDSLPAGNTHPFRGGRSAGAHDPACRGAKLGCGAAAPRASCSDGGGAGVRQTGSAAGEDATKLVKFPRRRARTRRAAFPGGLVTRRGPLAQRSEQRTHNPSVAGSNPAGPTINPVIPRCNAARASYSRDRLPTLNNETMRFLPSARSPASSGARRGVCWASSRAIRRTARSNLRAPSGSASDTRKACATSPTTGPGIRWRAGPRMIPRWRLPWRECWRSSDVTTRNRPGGPTWIGSTRDPSTWAVRSALL